jgi:hypothetical protein
MTERLAAIAAGAVNRTVDTGSVARLEFEVEAEVQAHAGRGRRRSRVRVPVAVTVYKQHSRVRIQLMSHVLEAGAARALEDRIAAALGAQIVSRADAHPADHEHSPDPAAHTAAPQPIARRARRRPEEQ